MNALKKLRDAISCGDDEALRNAAPALLNFVDVVASQYDGRRSPMWTHINTERALDRLIFALSKALGGDHEWSETVPDLRGWS